MMLSDELDSVMLLSEAQRVGGLICFLRFRRRCLCRDSLREFRSELVSGSYDIFRFDFVCTFDLCKYNFHEDRKVNSHEQTTTIANKQTKE